MTVIDERDYAEAARDARVLAFRARAAALYAQLKAQGRVLR